MGNLMSNIYIGLVTEIIKENGKPTLDIRVRIPSLHIGLKDEDLPIAKPIIMPGMFVDPIHFENYFSRVNRVYVIFDSGSKAMPRYFGALGEGAYHDIPSQAVESVNDKVGTVVINADDIPFDGTDTNYLVNKLDVEAAVKELDTRVSTNVDMIQEVKDYTYTFVGTMEEYNVANAAGQIRSGTLVIITDEEEEIPNPSVITAVLGAATLGSMILGHE